MWGSVDGGENRNNGQGYIELWGIKRRWCEKKEKEEKENCVLGEEWK